MSNLISAAELRARLGAPELRIVDVRASLTDPKPDAGFTAKITSPAQYF